MGVSGSVGCRCDGARTANNTPINKQIYCKSEETDVDDELAAQICGILTHAPEAYHRVLVFVTGDGNAHKVGRCGGWVVGGVYICICTWCVIPPRRRARRSTTHPHPNYPPNHDNVLHSFRGSTPSRS